MFGEWAEEIKDELIDIRRQIHRHPELGMEEWETAGLAARHLQRLGLSVSTGIGGTGVCAVLEGQQPEPVIALRADMDALAVQELNDVSYRSCVDGVMHACGHDGHVAMLLGAARLLTRYRTRLQGSVKFILQPAEEGPGGAKPMIEAGVLESPPVAAIVGAHLWSDLPLETVAIRPGKTMAAVGRFTIRIQGRGGHAAIPHQTVDSVVVAAHVISALQGIVSRESDPLRPVVLTVGTVHGGSRYNVIAGSVEMTGTVRTLDGTRHDFLPEKMRRLIAGVTAACGAGFEFEYEPTYPELVNDRNLTELVRSSAGKILGNDGVTVWENPLMVGEDFAFFAREVPAAFFFVGFKTEDRQVYPHHHPRFDIDERALPLGAAILAQVAADYLNGDRDCRHETAAQQS